MGVPQDPDGGRIRHGFEESVLLAVKPWISRGVSRWRPNIDISLSVSPRLSSLLLCSPEDVRSEDLGDFVNPLLRCESRIKTVERL
jgi:hypothetical protein